MSALKRNGNGNGRCPSSSESDSSDDEATSFKRNKRMKGQAIRQISPPRSNSSSNGTRVSNANCTSVSLRSMAVDKSVSGSDVNGKPKVKVPLVSSGQLSHAKQLPPGRQLVSYADCDNPSAAEIMTTMGFEKGKGFAKVIPIITKKKYSYNVNEFEEKVTKLNIDNDDINIELEKSTYEEEVNWIPPEVPKPTHVNGLLSSRKVGPRPTSNETDNTFVDTDVVKELILCKKLFQDLDENHYQTIRARSNVFEKLGKGPFICRAAMKMANLDAVLGYALTEPKSQSGNQVVENSDLFYFADVCAGPGGFTEYVLWKKTWEAKGFGLTLKGDLDFDLKNFEAAGPESFEAYYGPASDGNIYNPDNVVGYINYVLSGTTGKGVHLMMADGGFSVSKQENMQEILSGQIVLSQCAVALGVVRQGGHFVCKLFDIFTPFSVGLIYLMYQCFDLVSIHKPNTSRPANSERYLICKWKREGTDTVFKYLMDCHRLFWKYTSTSDSDEEDNDSDQTILELLDQSVLVNTNHAFYKYIRESNNSIAKAQIQCLKRMIAYVRDPELLNPNQIEAKTKCLELWKVPAEISKGIKSTAGFCKEVLAPYPITMFAHDETNLTPERLDYFFKSPYDWRFVVVGGFAGSKKRGFYLSTGRNLVFHYFGRLWVLANVVGSQLWLASNTLVYGEIVNEIHGKRPSQKVVSTFHIIDALILGGKDVRNLHYTERHECCVKFAKSMNNNIPGRMPIRAKNPVRMENIADVIDRLEHRVVKGAGQGSKLVCPVDHTDETSPVIEPAGMLFVKITRDPWQMALNRQANRKYWFNTLSGKAKDSVPEEAISDFFWTMAKRVVWWWDKQTNVVISSMENSDPRINQLSAERVHAFSIANHVHTSLRCAPYVAVSKPVSHPPVAQAPQ